MSSFEEKVRAFNLGMSFQDGYVREISAFKADVLHRLSLGERLTSAQAEVLLTTNSAFIDQTLTEWGKVIFTSKIRLCRLLSDFHISEAYMQQRTWADGQWRIYGEVLDMYILPDSAVLKAPTQVSERSVTAIREAFPVTLSGTDPLGGADREFEAQLRARGNPWAECAG